MTDEQMPNEIPAFIKPWINLIHTVGLPWVIIGLSAWYGIPFANEALKTQRAVIESVDVLSKKMETSIFILDSIHRTNVHAAVAASSAAAMIHEDAHEAKVLLESKDKDKQN